MKHATPTLLQLGSFAALAVTLALTAPCLASDHLLISEVCANSGSLGSFIEVHNPTNVSVDLSKYYLADNSLYPLTPKSTHQTPLPGDFVARFPNGSTLAAGATITIAMNFSGYFNTYLVSPDYYFPGGKAKFSETAQLMTPAYAGSINGDADIVDAGEGVILYHWDGLTDLVEDVDLIRIGQPVVGNDLQSKTGVTCDGPDADAVASPYKGETITMPVMTMNAGDGFSYKRLLPEFHQEVNNCDGNGITGDQELTENIAVTWDGSGANTFTPPTPGTVPNLASPPPGCYADINGSGAVNVTDLLLVIGTWGICGNCASCPADISPLGCHDCAVNVSDLLAVIGTWGTCP